MVSELGIATHYVIPTKKSAGNKLGSVFVPRIMSLELGNLINVTAITAIPT